MKSYSQFKAEYQKAHPTVTDDNVIEFLYGDYLNSEYGLFKFSSNGNKVYARFVSHEDPIIHDVTFFTTPEKKCHVAVNGIDAGSVHHLFQVHCTNAIEIFTLDALAAWSRNSDISQYTGELKEAVKKVNSVLFNEYYANVLASVTEMMQIINSAVKNNAAAQKIS